MPLRAAVDWQERGRLIMRFLRRPQIDSRPASLLAGLWILATCNFTFWPMAFKSFEGWTPAFVGFALSISFLILSLFVAVSAKYLFRPLASFLILVAAGASYFTDTFGTIVNQQMIDSAMTTNAREAGALISTRFLTHFAFFGLLPVGLLWWVRVRHEPIAAKVRGNLKLIVPMLLATGILVYWHIGSFIVTLRQDRLTMQTLNPVAPLSGAWKYGRSLIVTSTREMTPLGTDAQRGPVIAASTRPVVTVLVTGETARAMNFSLNGYDRKTNPELETLDIVNFPNVTSCGTDTATSVPCMYSVYGRANYDHADIRRTEGLLDVLKHAGVEAHWWDNNTGSKGAADRVNYVPLMDTEDPVLCPENECRDEIFLKRLEEKLATTETDTVIVLHQIGSHGPSYYRRYSDSQRLFTPDCRTPDLPKCSLEEVRNAYDNTIVATDAFLASVIRILDRHGSDLDTALLYVSDHGESLGENGLFLHGAPYAFAPKEQTHVPMIAWFSKGFADLYGLDRACLAKNAPKPYSHDNWFHTTLGLFDIRTSVYKPELDILRPCRAKG